MADTTQQIDAITRAIGNLDTKLNSVLPKLSSLINPASSNSASAMSSSLATFSSASGGILGGALQMGAGIAVGTSMTLPNVAATQNYNMQYYQGSIFNPGFNKTNMMNATFSAMKGGISSPGSDAMAANYIMNRGVAFSTDQNSTFMQMMRGTKNAAMYLGMDNQTASAALENLTSGQTSANLMQSLGIYTSDPMSGKAYDQNQIFSQIESILTAGQGKMSASEILDTYRRGNLGASLTNLGLSDPQQQMFLAYMVNKAGGKTMDLGNDKAMKSIIGANNAMGNTNPGQSSLNIYSTMTDQMKSATGVYETGANQSAAWFESLNGTVKDLISTFGQLNATLQTSMGTPAGAGMVTAGSMVASGLSQMVNGVFKIFGGGTSNGNGTGGFSDSGTPGGMRTAQPANGPITARLGQKGPMWGPRGHNGTDFGVPDNSPVYAAADGVVSKNAVSQAADGGYGHYLTVDHGNGYKTLYAHLDPSSADVHEGDKVTAGQVIGRSGHTGHVTGPHLHFEVQKDGTSVPPDAFLSGAVQIDPKNAGNTTTTASNSDGLGATFAALSASVGELLGISSAAPTPKVASWTGSKTAAVPTTGQAASGQATGLGGVSGGVSLGSVTPASVISGGGSPAKIEINLNIGQATESEARKFAELVKQVLDEHVLSTNMGSR